MNLSVSKYKGNYVLCLNPRDEYKVRIGLAKARKILDAFEMVREHVRLYEGERGKLPELVLDPGGQYPLELSYYKCDKIIDHQSELREFVREYEDRE